MKRLTAAILALCIMLGAALAEESAGIILPEPEFLAEGQLIGDYADPISREVTIFYPSEDGSALTSVTRTIQAEREEQLLAAVLYEVLNSGDRRSAVRSWAADIRLLGAELSCGTATVILSLDAGVRQSELGYLLLCRSIANTLLGMNGISAINILTAGRSENLCGMPVGVFTQSNDAVSTEYAVIQNEQKLFLEDETGAISRNAALYFPSRDGRFMLCESRSLKFENTDYISVLLAALAAGPALEDCAFSPIPASLNLLRSEPALLVSDDGRRIIEMDLSETLLNYLAFSGSETWQLYASLALSICSFVPEIDGLHLLVEGTPVEQCDLDGKLVQFSGGIIRREDFTHRIGSIVPLYFTNEEGKLTRVIGTAGSSGAFSAKSVLCEMIAADAPQDQNLTSVFPAGILPADILGVRVEDGVATVNLSAGFYSCCQILQPEEERNLIYAMVNALCELEQIGSVRFLVEGRVVNSLSQNIYLKSTLLPNPGLAEKGPEE